MTFGQARECHAAGDYPGRIIGGAGRGGSGNAGHSGRFAAACRLLARGEMLENKRERIYLAKGELLTLEGKVLAASTAKYMPIRSLDPAILLTDFEGTEEQVREFLLGHKQSFQ